MLGDTLVIRGRFYPVARQDGVAEPHVPSLRKLHYLVMLGQRYDTAVDQQVREVAIGWRQRHGYLSAERDRRLRIRCKVKRKVTVAKIHKAPTIQDWNRFATVIHEA